MTTKLTVKALATFLNEDPKLVRRFLRQTTKTQDQPSGSRRDWNLELSPETYKKRFDKWFEERANRTERLARDNRSTPEHVIRTSTGGFLTH